MKAGQLRNFAARFTPAGQITHDKDGLHPAAWNSVAGSPFRRLFWIKRLDRLSHRWSFLSLRRRGFVPALTAATAYTVL